MAPASFSVAGMEVPEEAMPFLGALLCAVVSTSLAAAWGNLLVSLAAFLLSACACHCLLQLTTHGGLIVVKHTEAETQRDATEARLGELIEAVAGLGEGVRSLQGCVEDTRGSACGVAEANARLAAALASLEAVSGDSAALRGENSRLGASVEALGRELGDLRATNARLEAGFQELESVSRENGLLLRETEDLKADIARMEADLAELDAVMYENADLKSENSRLEATLRELDAVAGENAALIAENGRLKGEVEEMETLAEENARLKGEVEDMEGLVDENEELKATLAEKVRLFKEYFDLRRTMDEKANGPSLKRIAELEGVVKAQHRQILLLRGQTPPESSGEGEEGEREGEGEEGEDSEEEASEGASEESEGTDGEAEAEEDGEVEEVGGSARVSGGLGAAGEAGSGGLASGVLEGARVGIPRSSASDEAPLERDGSKEASAAASAAAAAGAAATPSLPAAATPGTAAAAAAGTTHAGALDTLGRPEHSEETKGAPSEAGTSPILRPIDTSNTSEPADRSASQDSDLALAPGPLPALDPETPKGWKQEELQRQITKAFDIGGTPAPAPAPAPARPGKGGALLGSTGASGGESDREGGGEACSTPGSRAMAKRRGLGGWLRTR